MNSAQACGAAGSRRSCSSSETRVCESDAPFILPPPEVLIQPKGLYRRLPLASVDLGKNSRALPEFPRRSPTIPRRGLAPREARADRAQPAPSSPKEMLMFRAFWDRLAPPSTRLSRCRGLIAQRRSRATRPAVEILEDRLTPSTFLVTNPSD